MNELSRLGMPEPGTRYYSAAANMLYIRETFYLCVSLNFPPVKWEAYGLVYLEY